MNKILFVKIVFKLTSHFVTTGFNIWSNKGLKMRFSFLMKNTNRLGNNARLQTSPSRMDNSEIICSHKHNRRTIGYTNSYLSLKFIRDKSVSFLLDKWVSIFPNIHKIWMNLFTFIVGSKDRLQTHVLLFGNIYMIVLNNYSLHKIKGNKTVFFYLFWPFYQDIVTGNT